MNKLLIRSDSSGEVMGLMASFVSYLMEQQRVVGDLLDDGGVLEGRLPLHAHVGGEEVVAQLARGHTWRERKSDL